MSMRQVAKNTRDTWLNRCLRRGITEEQIVTWLAEVLDEEPNEMVERLRDKERITPEEWMDYAEWLTESRQRRPEESPLTVRRTPASTKTTEVKHGIRLLPGGLRLRLPHPWS